MAIPESIEFSLRDRFGLVAGISWGLVLGRFFAAGDMTGPWLVILFGLPVILSISPARPILSWQLPILSAVVFSVVIYRCRKALSAAPLWALWCGLGARSSPRAQRFPIKTPAAPWQLLAPGPARPGGHCWRLLFA